MESSVEWVILPSDMSVTNCTTLVTIPLVSILTPVYNGRDYIAYAIESALTQTYPNLEILVVNDGSIDDSAQVISRYLSDPRVKYFEQPNRGVAAARNTALAHATGEYVGFLDQDDAWLPEKLAIQVAYMESHPEIAMVHSRQNYVDQNRAKLASEFINVEGIEGHCFTTLFNKNRIAVLTVLARRKAIVAAGGFNPLAARADDYELWLRIALRERVGFIDQVLATYCVHLENASHDAFKMSLAELSAIDSVLKTIPEVHSTVKSSVIRARLFTLHWQLGNWYMWKFADFANARRHFELACKARPWALAAWGRRFWCCLDPAQRRALAWWKVRLRLGARD